MILLWFRDDLRTLDHAPLAWALAQRPAVDIAAVFILEEPATPSPSLADAAPAPTTTDPSALPLPRPYGSAQRWWLHHSLRAHAQRLASLGIRLHIRRGHPARVLPQLADELSATAIAWQRRYHALALDTWVKDWATQRFGADRVHTTPGYLLNEPWTVETGAGEPYKVYTPFSRRAAEQVPPYSPLDPHDPNDPDNPTLHHTPTPITADLDAIDALDLLPQRDWADRFGERFTPGELGAQDALDCFLNSDDYDALRDFPAVRATSGLSPYLRFGEISPALLWALISDSPTFRKELLWRDFAWHRLWSHPDMATRNVRPQFDAFPWEWNPQLDPRTYPGPFADSLPTSSSPTLALDLAAWQRGRTGIPLVDAGMRELWVHGTMHNRVRMVVASWLTKNLGIHWRHGEEWFWDTLLDADPASNPFNWQWVAGCGDDASPYFRIFNPLTQAEKFDAEGRYIARYLPDLADYPPPMRDVKQSRKDALEAYQLAVKNA